MTLEQLRQANLIEELARVAPPNGNAEIILERAAFPRIFSPTNAIHALDFWEKVCQMIENGIVGGGLEPVLASAARMFPGNNRLAPFRSSAPVVAATPSAVAATVAAGEKFDVFLSYRSADREEVERLAESLKLRGVKAWLDLWHMPAGAAVVNELDQVLRDIPAIAVCVGQSGVGPWQAVEIQAAIYNFVQKKRKVIPVLLPSAPENVDWPYLLYMFSRVRIEGAFSGTGFEKLLRSVKK